MVTFNSKRKEKQDNKLIPISIILQKWETCLNYMKFVEFNVDETEYPYKSHKAESIDDARKIKAALTKLGINTNIIGITEHGNDYIIK